MKICFLFSLSLFLVLCPSLIFPQGIELKQQQLQELEKKLEETEESIKKTQQEKDKTQKTYTQNSGKLKETDKKIKQLAKSEKTTKTEIDKTVGRINERENQIKALNRDTDRLFLSLFKEKYFKDTNSSEVYYSNTLALAINSAASALNKILSDKEKLELKRNETESKYKSIVKNKESESKKKEKISSEIKKLKTNIEKLEKQEKEIASVYETLKQDANELQTLLNKLLVDDSVINNSYLFSSDKLIWPVSGKICREFGEIKDSATKTTIINNGIDIEVEEGAGVVAVDNGIVAFSEWYAGAGRLLIIDHQNGYQSIYSHNSSLLVSKGDQVKRNQVIALAGSTGNVDKPVLHFEIRRDGKPVDPLEYLE